MIRVRFAAALMAATAILGVAAWLMTARAAFAHCDTLDGPVVSDARAALEKSDLTPALKWVRAHDEPELKAAFDKAVAVRAKGPEARDLADTFFFETLVRLHRAGEGAPYTGLKPAGEVEPPIAAADKALADGNVETLAQEIGAAAEAGVKQRFERLLETRRHKDESVDAGREYVEAYVVFIHYVEGIHNAVSAGAGHAAEQEGQAPSSPAHAH